MKIMLSRRTVHIDVELSLNSLIGKIRSSLENYQNIIRIVDNFDIGIYFTESEITNLQGILRILTPIEEIILYLIKGTVTLDQGLTAIEFVQSKIAGFDSDIATLILFN